MNLNAKYSIIHETNWLIRGDSLISTTNCFAGESTWMWNKCKYTPDNAQHV